MRRLICAMLLTMCGVAWGARSGPAPARGWVVVLNEKAVSERYPGRIETIRAAAAPYRQHLRQVQADLRSRIEGMHVHVTGGVQHVMNAMFVVATPKQAEALRSMPGVKSVSPMHLYHKEDQLTLSNVQAAWNTSVIGGESNAGAGLKIAIIDTGIDQTHPSFQDSSLTPPAGFPVCDTNSQPCSDYTNNKVIVARSYVDTLVQGYAMSGTDPAQRSRPDDLSARDRDGHGTGVASVAAGVPVTHDGTTLTGVAPKAFLGNYKIFGSEANPNGAGDIISAIDDAITDGMDVINLSLGGPSYNGPLDTGAACGLPSGQECDPLAFAIQGAVQNAQVVVVAAAGNDGANGYQFNYGCIARPCFSTPTFSTVGSPAYTPNAIAAGGIENDVTYTERVQVTGSGVPSNLQQITATESANGPAPDGPLTAPVIDVTQAGDSDGLLCLPISPSALAGSLGLVQRGSCNFSTKVANAAQAGAVGVIFIDDGAGLAGWTAGTGAAIPGFLISVADGANLKSYVDAHGGTQATLNPNPFQVPASVLGFIPDSVAFFASRGPVIGTGALKPDVSAAATDFLLASENYDLFGALFSFTRFGTADGTSFASPMIAGAAALVKQANPGLTPLQIGSALINSGSLAGLLTSDGTNPASPTEVGSGLLQAQNAVISTVQFVPASISFGQLNGGLPAPVSLTASNTGGGPVTLNLSVQQPPNLAAGTQVQVDGSTNESVTIPAGQSTTITASLSGGVPGPGRYEGLVSVSGGLTIPYMFLVGDGIPYDIIPLNAVAPGTPGAFDGAVNATIPWYGVTGECPPQNSDPNSCVLDYGSIAVMVIDQYGAAVPGYPVSWAATQGGGSILQGSQFTDAATDSYGIAGASVTLGPNPGTQEFTATVNGMNMPFDGTARNVPTITRIVDAAAFTNGRAVAPGSYLAIYGSNLSDVTDTAYASCPECSTAVTPFPLGLDGVAFSIDVLSANLSIPGRFLFVSPGQVNVLLPWELAGQTSATVKVMVNYTYSAEYTLPLAAYSPGFFLNFATPVNGQLVAAVVDATTSQILGVNGATASAGDALELYLNGLGPVTNQPGTGFPAPAPPNAALTTTQPDIKIGGIDVGTPLYSGLAPGQVGEYQVNVVVPSGVGSGLQPITLSIGGVTATAMIPMN